MPDKILFFGGDLDGEFLSIPRPLPKRVVRRKEYPPRFVDPSQGYSLGNIDWPHGPDQHYVLQQFLHRGTVWYLYLFAPLMEKRIDNARIAELLDSRVK